jgi:hypothetical protein
MKIAAFILVALAARAISAQTSQPAWQTIEQGELILRPFNNAPFPHKSRDYTDSTVAIFIPRDYRAGEVVNYVVHFHGHKNNVAHVLEQYKLIEQFAAAKVNAILLVPQGPKDAADSGGGKMEDPGGFGRLINEITRYLRSEKKIRAATIGRVVLSAHSGGYYVAARVLYHGGLGREISDVLLLDATYGELATFANWAHNNHDTRLVSLYTDHLAQRNSQLLQLVKDAGLTPVELDEAALKDADLREKTPIFVHTKLKHDQVPQLYFERLLRTSALTK